MDHASSPQVTVSLSTQLCKRKCQENVAPKRKPEHYWLPNSLYVVGNRLTKERLDFVLCFAKIAICSNFNSFHKSGVQRRLLKSLPCSGSC